MDLTKLNDPEETFEVVPLEVTTEVDDQGFVHASVCTRRSYSIQGAPPDSPRLKRGLHGSGISRQSHIAISYALEDLAKQVAAAGPVSK